MAFMRDEFLKGARACLPTVPGYLGIGFSCGALAAVSGMTPAEVGLLSLLLYAGSGQFAVAGLYQAAASFSTIWSTVFFLNLRHLLLTTYLSRHYTPRSRAEACLVGSLITDETFGVAAVEGGKHGKLSYEWLMGLNWVAYVNWFIGNVAGAVVAGRIPAAALKSLGFALTAMFIGLLVLQLDRSRDSFKREFSTVMMTALGVLSGFPLLLAVMASILATQGGSRWPSARKWFF